ncbi:MAG: hypothetical protein ACRDK7_01150 [Solirubrobacteraceae bacterium]
MTAPRGGARRAEGSAAERLVYGLRVAGVPATPWLADADERPAPRVQIEHRAVVTEPASLDGERACLHLPDGRLLVADRAGGTVTFGGEPLDLGDLVHPYLGPVGTLFNRWLRREAFHGGSFVAGGRAWVVRGRREAGKSTLLAALAARQVAILADDITVIDRGMALAGPRCLDLRAVNPGAAFTAVPARAGTRLRLPLPAIDTRVPLGGWIYLEWGDSLQIELLPAATRVSRLMGGRAWPQLTSDPSVLLDLAALPAWRLARPRDRSMIPACAEMLEEAVISMPRQGAIGRS